LDKKIRRQNAFSKMFWPQLLKKEKRGVKEKNKVIGVALE